MKKYYVLLTLFSFLLIQIGFGNGVPVSESKNSKQSSENVDTSTKCCNEIKTKVLELNNSLKITSKNVDTIKTALHTTESKFDKDNFWGMGLIIGFLVLLIVIITILICNQESMRDFISENYYITKTIKNDSYNDANIQLIAANAMTAPLISSILPPTIEVSDDNSKRPLSSSRLLALITSIITLLLVICMSVFYVYSYLKNPLKPIDFSGLTTALVSLLGGFAPYAFNKLSDGIKK